jgi:ribonuclease P protein component
MLPQKNRISRKEFPSHKERGIRVFSPLFSGVFYKIVDPRVLESRVSVVVSKKTAKTAVSRNFLRRRVYEVLAPHILNISSPTTIVIYPKKEAEKAQFSDLKSEVEKALRQAKLIN